jgi:nitroreductase/NAD-dependent dihydropyrimidine dehydrogenase PreA subunit
LIEIDAGKCIRCLQCTAACSLGVIHAKEGAPYADNSKFCMRCFHCAAACPSGAVRIDGEENILPDDSISFTEDYQVNLRRLILQRRSFRHFEDRDVPDELIREVLETAGWMPSTKNEQPTRWLCVKDRIRIHSMMGQIIDYVEQSGDSPEVKSEYGEGNNMVIGNSRCLLITYSDGKYRNPYADAVIQTTAVQLLLESRGIASCWSGYLASFIAKNQSIKDLLGLPEGAAVHTALMTGYPAVETYLHLPKRKNLDLKTL